MLPMEVHYAGKTESSHPFYTSLQVLTSSTAVHFQRQGHDVIKFSGQDMDILGHGYTGKLLRY